MIVRFRRWVCFFSDMQCSPADTGWTGPDSGWTDLIGMQNRLPALSWDELRHQLPCPDETSKNLSIPPTCAGGGRDSVSTVCRAKHSSASLYTAVIMQTTVNPVTKKTLS